MMEHLSSTEKTSALWQHKKDGILSVYFTGGYPSLDNTMEIASCLQEAGPI